MMKGGTLELQVALASPKAGLVSRGIGAARQEPLKPASQAVLRVLFEENYAFIWRVLRRLGVKDEGVDDAAQQVFVVAARKVELLEAGKERSFLLGTAIRIAAEYRRRNLGSRELATESMDEEPSPAMNPEELMERKSALAFLDRVLGAMDVDRRTVFVLFETEGLSTDEIAQSLGVPRGTVSSRLRLAREEFQAIAKRERARQQGGRP